MITAKKIRKTFSSGPTVLDNVSFQVPDGEIVSFIGPSGCGKSTLLRLIAGLDEVSSGQLLLDRDRSDVGFVFQDATLLPWRNVIQNVTLPLELAGQLDAKAANVVREKLRLTGLAHDDELKFPAMLSGGMRMRVSLARTLVMEPAILLLDEPFAALDEVLRQQLNEDLLSIWAAQSSTMVFVTHNVGEAVFLSHRVFVMSANPGRIMEEVEIPFDFPRSWDLRTQPEFLRQTAKISQRLREAVMA